jgi:hypothetical protein
LTRYRDGLVREQSRVANRIQKVIESGNIKLGQVASDALGVSGRAMLWALARGETDGVKLAALARRQLKTKVPQLERALQGRLTVNQRFVLQELLKHWEELEQADRRVTKEIDHMCRSALSWPEPARLWTVLSGFGPRVAEVVIAEIGVEMNAVFPSDANLTSWLAFVLVINKLGVRDFRVVRAKATPTCARPWCKLPGARP